MDGIDSLSPKEKAKFEKIVNDVLNDRQWCSQHEIDYSNPNEKLARQILYHKMYTQPRFFNAVNPPQTPVKRQDKDWTKYRKKKN
jgi:hypothetical protein